MIKVFVVEDEDKIRETTLAMLGDLDVEVLGSAPTVDDAFQGIISKRPDLVLLDVELGRRSSFELLQKFQEIPFQVIFTTGHQKYAFDAFRFSAIDYLLKPLSVSKLKDAIDKAEQRLSLDNSPALHTLQHNLQANYDEQKIVLKTQDKIHVLKIREIIRCESDLSYTIFYTASEKIIVSKTLRHYDELLADSGFFRIHKSHLINLHHIVKIHKADGGEVEMSGGDRIGISQRKRDEFLQIIGRIGIS
ncbi:MAG: LytTR family DNA-binding domain-containing protein [Cyclobacteriaceae bacterium]